MTDQSQRSPRQRKGRILYVLLFALLFTGFVPVLFVVRKLTGLYEEELRSTLGEKQFIVASAITEVLDAHVEGSQQRVAEIGEALTSLAATSGDDRVRRLVREQGFLQRFVDEDLVLLRYQDRAGRTWEATSTPEIPDVWVERLLANATGSAEELIGDPTLVPELGVPLMVISRPIQNGRRVSGVVSGVFNLKPTWDALMDRLNVPYTAYVLDPEGRLFAHTDPEQLGRPMPRHYLVERFLGPGGRDRETTSFQLSAGARGDIDVLGTKIATRRGWGVFVQVEEDLAFAPAANLRAQARNWALGTLVLGIGAAVLFAGYLTRPIQRLAEAARAFAAGRYGQRVQVHSTTELGELADTFNFMSSEIEKQVQQLREAAEENRELFLGTIRALAVAIDEKDPYTRGHSERVNRLSMIIGKHLGMSESDLEDLNVASLLHDLGKIGVDDRILRKPAALTDEEFEVMKTHPTRGANILTGVKALEKIIPGMKHHHERWSGGGYPDGLKGEEIPLPARIIQIADAYDAMTTNRPYQRAMRPEAAAARINELAGKVSDPAVVEAFNRAYKSGDLAAEALRPGAPTARAIRERTAS